MCLMAIEKSLAALSECRNPSGARSFAFLGAERELGRTGRGSGGRLSDWDKEANSLSMRKRFVRERFIRFLKQREQE